MMTERQDPRGKWGLFNITDEQAERINNGDVEEFDLFFLRNLDYITNRCKELFFRKGRLNDYQEGVNSVYVDMRYKLPWKSASALEGIINSACYYSEYGGRAILDKDCPHFVEYSKFRPEICTIDLTAEGSEGGEYKSGYILDIYGITAPSPFEELDGRERLSRGNNVKLLTRVLSPFLTKRQLDFLPFMLNGNTESFISEALGVSTDLVNTTRRSIRLKFIVNYKEILEALKCNGYNVARYVNVIPPDYCYAVRALEARKGYANKYARKKAKEKREALALERSTTQ